MCYLCQNLNFVCHFDQTGDELLSDSFPCKKIENGMLWEVEGKVLLEKKALICMINHSSSLKLYIDIYYYVNFSSSVGCEKSNKFQH